MPPSRAVPVGGLVAELPHQTLHERVVVVVPVLTYLAVDLETFEVPLQDEIDDTGDGVRTVGRGCAAGDHFDAIHQADRNLIEVGSRLRDGGIWRTRSEPAAVDQHQGTARSKSAQVRGGDAAGAGQTGRAVAEILAQIIGEHLRQLIDDIADVGLAGRLDGLSPR